MSADEAKRHFAARQTDGNFDGGGLVIGFVLDDVTAQFNVVGFAGVLEHRGAVRQRTCFALGGSERGIKALHHCPKLPPAPLVDQLDAFG